MLMKNFNAFNIDSLVVLPGLIDLKVTGLNVIYGERLNQFSRLIHLQNLEIGVYTVEPLASNIYCNVLDLISTLVNLNRLTFIVNVEIDYSILESRRFILLFFQKQTNVSVMFKDRNTEYIFAPTEIQKNGLILVTRNSFFAIQSTKANIPPEVLKDHVSVTNIKELRRFGRAITDNVQRLTIHLTNRQLSREIVDIFETASQLFGRKIKELTLSGIRIGICCTVVLFKKTNF